MRSLRTCRGEAAAIDHLHEIEEVVQIKHPSPIVQYAGRWVRFLALVIRESSDYV
jgi:hypothetical protein